MESKSSPSKSNRNPSTSFLRHADRQRSVAHKVASGSRAAARRLERDLCTRNRRRRRRPWQEELRRIADRGNQLESDVVYCTIHKVVCAVGRQDNGGMCLSPP